MAKLKRNTIQLIKDTKAEEVEFQTFLTPHFIPFDMVYEAIDLLDEIEKEGNEMKPREMIDKLIHMTVRIYNDQFTVDDLKARLHAPDGMTTLRDQVLFVTQGQQTDETKNFIASMK